LETSISQACLDGLALKARKTGDDESIVTLKFVFAKLREGSLDDSQSDVPLSNHPGTGDTPTMSQKLQHLKKGIELHKTGPASKCLRRFYLAMLVDEYFKAQADAETKAAFLAALSSSSKKGTIIEEAASRPGPRLASRVLARFIDQLFPETVSFTRDDATQQERKIRKQMVSKFQKWKMLGKAWEKLMARFGAGTLLILPDDLSDEE
jgi:hypothetical protein